MIRLLASVGLILVMVVTMDRVLASSLGAMLLRSDDRFLSIYKPGQSAEVVILGNSRADNHFPPEAVKTATCSSTINLGMGGGPTTVSDVLFQDYVERHGAPRLLVVEPTSLVDPPALLSDLPLLSYYSERVDGFIRKADFSMWATNQAFNLMIFNSNQTIRVGLEMLRPQGGRTLKGTMSDALLQDIERLPNETMDAPQPNWDAMERIIHTAREHGTKVAVVVTPYHPSYIKKVENFDAFFDEMKRRLPSDVTFIDARRAVTQDASFMDALHINAEGVQEMFATIDGDLRSLGNCTVETIAQLGNVTAVADRAVETQP